MAGPLLDVYALRARVYPGLLVLLPVIATYAAAFPDQFTGFTASGPALGAAGLLYLLSQLVREAGKKKEAELWRRWGGKPTTAQLRMRIPVPSPARDLNRSRLTRIAPDVTLPTLEEERADPGRADHMYEAAVSVLREATRSTERFPVVFAENVSYGFRRNTWAIKPLGVTVAVASLLIALHLVAQPTAAGPAKMLGWVAVSFDTVLLVVWLFVVSDSWVRRAATAYTDALFAAAAEVVDR